MFFVLALGLGFPYLLLALFSGKIKNLPRAGSWMEGVKHIFGFLLLGMAFYFVNPILPKVVQPYTLPVFGVIAALILLFVDKMANNIKGFKIFKIIFSVVVLALSIYSLIPSEKISPDWQTFSDDKYAASINNNERIIIDLLENEAMIGDEICQITRRNITEISTTLSMMLMKDLLTEEDGKFYIS